MKGTRIAIPLTALTAALVLCATLFFSQFAKKNIALAREEAQDRCLRSAPGTEDRPVVFVSCSGFF